MKSSQSLLRVFIVILNWNQPELTKECLESVFKCQPSNAKISVVIVDNGSTDDSVKKLEKIKNIHLIKSKKNLGFAGGNNLGLEYSLDKGADYILVLNNDTIVDKKLIENLVSLLESDKKIGAASPKIYFAKGYEFHKERYKNEKLGKVIWYAGGQVDWNNIYGSNKGVDEVDSGQYNQTIETDFATGASVFLRSQALKEVGFFDERYFLYLEDLELSQRLKKSNWKVVYCPKGVVWHKVSMSSGIGSELNDYYITRNRLLFGNNYASFRTRLALFKESFKFLITGRTWQRKGVLDFYLGKFGKGSWR